MTMKERTGLKKQIVGQIDGHDVTSYTLGAGGNLTVTILDYGLAIMSLNYRGANRIQSFDDPEEYMSSVASLGKCLGRVAGRVSKALIRINGIEYPLDKNEGEDCVNGGFSGFSHQMWHFGGTEVTRDEKGDAVETLIFTLTSPDLEAGFPGSVRMEARFSLSAGNEFSVEYIGKTDQKTPLSVTQELHFNLHGTSRMSVLEHELTVNSREYLALNEKGHPKFFTYVKGTPFDYQEPRNLLSGMDALEKEGEGSLNHPFILNADEGRVTLTSPQAGVKLTVITTDPSVVIRTPETNSVHDGSEGGARPHFRQGVAILPQWFPNALNTEFLPDNLVGPGELYYSKSSYRFSGVEEGQFSE